MTGAWRSSTRRMRRPEFKKANSRSRFSRMAKSNSVLVKVVGLTLNVTSVPWCSVLGPTISSGPTASPALEADDMLEPVAPDANMHPVRQRVHHGGTHAVQAARDLVAVLVELAAGVQPGQHDLGGRDPLLRMDVGRDAAPVITHRDGAVSIQRERAHGGITGLRLVHRIVDDLERHVVQARAVIRVADVHARPLPHGVQPPQDRDGGSVVLAVARAGIRDRRGGIGHAVEGLRGVMLSPGI